MYIVKYSKMKNKKQIKKIKSRGVVATATTFSTFMYIYEFFINIFKKKKQK